MSDAPVVLITGGSRGIGAAAEKLVLPGLGPAIRESSAWGEGKASVAPWDVLSFKECAT